MTKKIARAMFFVWLVGAVAVLCGYQMPPRVIAAAACLSLAGINRIESERQE